MGDTTITEKDNLSGRVWPDSLCHSLYPVDIQKPDGDGIEIRPLQEGIVPRAPLSALRVQASCMAMGQAAGAAVLIAAREIPESLAPTWKRFGSCCASTPPSLHPSDGPFL